MKPADSAALGIALRTFDVQADVPTLARWLQRPHVSRWWGPHDHLVPLVTGRSRTSDAVITAHGRAIGYLCWQSPSAAELADAGLADLPEGLVDIDILIGEPECLGRGAGPRALALLLARLHGDGVAFAGAGTSTSNHAALRAFEKAGFRPFRDFADATHGRCRYLVALTGGAVAPAATGARRRS